MIKKIIWIAAAALVVYLLVVGVPKLIEGERVKEKARNAEMEQQANQRANAIVGGGGGGGRAGSGRGPNMPSMDNATRALNRSADESQQNEEEQTPPPADQDQQQ